MALFSRRLPHVLNRADLALVVAPTYGACVQVDFDEAHERMQRAVANHKIVEELYEGLSTALSEAKGLRTGEDELIDNLSAGVQKRRSRVKAAAVTPALAAVMVRINLELGYAPEMMRNALSTPQGKALHEQGLAEIGAFLVRELIK
jgi:hypothetical protein